MKKPLIILLQLGFLAVLLSGCSTYSTNSKEITFKTVMAENIKPEIYVGDLDEQAEDFTYLGWVDARVSPSNPFADKPTEHMADIVLANKARKRGAHAVTYVSYKRSTLGAMTARGQAVRINEIKDQEILNAQKNDKLKKQQAVKELLYGNSNAAPELDDIPVTSTTTGTVLPEEWSTGEKEQKPGTVADIKKKLVVYSPQIKETTIAQNDIDQVMLKLNQLRESAKVARDFDMYQGLTEVMELLREAKSK